MGVGFALRYAPRQDLNSISRGILPRRVHAIRKNKPPRLVSACFQPHGMARRVHASIDHNKLGLAARMEISEGVVFLSEYLASRFDWVVWWLRLCGLHSSLVVRGRWGRSGNVASGGRGLPYAEIAFWARFINKVFRM